MHVPNTWSDRIEICVVHTLLLHDLKSLRQSILDQLWVKLDEKVFKSHHESLSLPALHIILIRQEENFIFGCMNLHSLRGILQKSYLKGHWTSITSSPTFSKKVGIFMSLEVLAWVMTAYWVLHSRLTYFWRNLNISSIFYFSKTTSINTIYSSLWDTLKMMLFTKYLIKGKHTGRISWKFWYWFDLKSSTELDIKKIDVILVQCPFNC